MSDDPYQQQPFGQPPQWPPDAQPYQPGPPPQGYPPQRYPPQYPPGPGYGQQPGYGPAPYGYGPPPQQTNGLAIASLVLGIVWIYWIGSVLALIFGYIAKKQIRESGGSQSGNGLATAGIVLGWIGVGIFTIALVVGVVSAVTAPA